MTRLSLEARRILDSSIVNVAIPTIMNVFNANTNTVQWVSTIYLLALGVVVPLSGWLGDRFGFKNLYIASLIVFVMGSLICGLAWDINSLIVARVIQAVGGGMIMPTIMAMIYRMVPRDKIGGAMGIFGIALLVAPALGPTLGGYLVDGFGNPFYMIMDFDYDGKIDRNAITQLPSRFQPKGDVKGVFAAWSRGPAKSVGEMNTSDLVASWK